MITNEGDNIKLSVEQLLALDKFDKRLSNLKIEIDIHSRNIDSLRNTNAQLEKDNVYLTKQSEDKKEIVNQLNKEIERLQSLVIDNKNSVEYHSKEHARLSAEQESIKSQINERERIILEKEKINKEYSDNLRLSMENHNKEKEILSQKKQFLEGIISKL